MTKPSIQRWCLIRWFLVLCVYETDPIEREAIGRARQSGEWSDAI